jgi:hypothetical protein
MSSHGTRTIAHEADLGAAREQFLKPGRGGAEAGEGAVVQVNRGDRLLPQAGEHERGHVRGDGLPSAAGAAED